jgi:hypothetical protein
MRDFGDEKHYAIPSEESVSKFGNHFGDHRDSKGDAKVGRIILIPI